MLSSHCTIAKYKRAQTSRIIRKLHLELALSHMESKLNMDPATRYYLLRLWAFNFLFRGSQEAGALGSFVAGEPHDICWLEYRRNIRSNIGAYSPVSDHLGLHFFHGK